MEKHQSFTRSYKDFYEIFALVVRSYGIYPFKLQFADDRLGRKSWELRLTEPIYLPKWPIESGVPHPSVDISVHAAFRYTEGELLHTRSSVSLTYFKRDTHKKIAEPFENLRFDYHPDEDDIAHPILHAHIFAHNRPDSEPKLLKRSCLIDWQSLGKRLKSFRVPIPNMTLPSVLCCLVACHLGANHLKDLLDKTENTRELFPHLAISEEQKALFSHNSFAGSQWFERPK